MFGVDVFQEGLHVGFPFIGLAGLPEQFAHYILPRLVSRRRYLLRAARTLSRKCFLYREILPFIITAYRNVV